MGEARKKAAMYKPMNDIERAAALGNEPFKLAFDLLFGMVDVVYKSTGGVNNELIGIEFDGGKPKGVNVLLVKRLEDVPRLRTEMLLRWPMVAHVFEAWAAPDASARASEHPKRFDVVSIAMYTPEMAAFAQNRVDVVNRRVERGELVYPDRIEGRLAFDLPQRH